MTTGARVIPISRARQARYDALSERTRKTQNTANATKAAKIPSGARAGEGAARTSGRTSVAASARVSAEEAAKRTAREGRTAPTSVTCGTSATRTTRTTHTSRTTRTTDAAPRTPSRYRVRGAINSILAKPVATTAILFCSIIILVGVFLYPTARIYYQAIREQARLEAELTAVLERNQKMADDIVFLGTDEGIVQEARRTLGWVERGDNAVVVYGAGVQREPDVDADIVAGTVPAPETWYSPILDPLFGVK